MAVKRTTLECSNREHVIKAVYSKIETDQTIADVNKILDRFDGPTAMSAIMYWRYTPTLRWAVHCAKLGAVNAIPEDICESCKKNCEREAG